MKELKEEVRAIRMLGGSGGVPEKKMQKLEKRVRG